MADDYPPYGAPRPVRFVPTGGRPAIIVAEYAPGVVPVEIVADDTGYPAYGGPLLLTEVADDSGYPRWGGPMRAFPTGGGGSYPYLSDRTASADDAVGTEIGTIVVPSRPYPTFLAQLVTADSAIGAVAGAIRT